MDELLAVVLALLLLDRLDRLDQRVQGLEAHQGLAKMAGLVVGQVEGLLSVDRLENVAFRFLEGPAAACHLGSLVDGVVVDDVH